LTASALTLSAAGAGKLKEVAQTFKQHVDALLKGFQEPAWVDRTAATGCLGAMLYQSSSLAILS
jgi:hypothetical protein